MSRLSYVVMFTATLALDGCNSGLRVGEVRGGLAAVVASNVIEASPVGCLTKGQAEIVVTNQGAQPSMLRAPALSAGLSPVQPPSQVGTCVLGTILAPSQSCSIRVRATPVAEGDRTELVVVTGAPGGAAEQDLTITGRPNLSATPASLSIVTEADAGQASGQVVVGVGAMPAALAPALTGPDADRFSIEPSVNQTPATPCTTYDLTVSFSRNTFASVGVYNATLLLDANADGGTSPMIPVTAEVR